MNLDAYWCKVFIPFMTWKGLFQHLESYSWMIIMTICMRKSFKSNNDVCIGHPTIVRIHVVPTLFFHFKFDIIILGTIAH